MARNFAGKCIFSHQSQSFWGPKAGPRPHAKVGFASLRSPSVASQLQNLDPHLDLNQGRVVLIENPLVQDTSGQKTCNERPALTVSKYYGCGWYWQSDITIARYLLL